MQFPAIFWLSELHKKQTVHLEDLQKFILDIWDTIVTSKSLAY